MNLNKLIKPILVTVLILVLTISAVSAAVTITPTLKPVWQSHSVEKNDNTPSLSVFKMEPAKKKQLSLEKTPSLTKNKETGHIFLEVPDQQDALNPDADRNATLAPVVTLVAPLNASITDSANFSLWFYVEVPEGEFLDECLFYGYIPPNTFINMQHPSPLPNSQNSFEVTDIADNSDFYWTVGCSDQDNGPQWAETEWVTFVRINDPPEQTQPLEITFEEDGSAVVDLDDYFFDVDGDELQYSDSGLTHIHTDENGSIWTFTADQDWNGMETMQLTVSDGQLFIEVDVNITVTPVNDAPVVIFTPTQTTLVEDHEWSYQVTAEDVDGDNVTFSLISVVRDAEIDSETGLLTWTPVGSDVGQRTITVGATDNGQPQMSGAASANLTVIPVLDVVDMSVTTQEGSFNVEDGSLVEDVRLGETLEFDITVLNRYDLEDDNLEGMGSILVTAVAEDILPGLEIVVNEEPFFLWGEQHMQLFFNLQVPYDTAEEDFTVSIDAEGNDVYGDPHTSQKNIDFTIAREVRNVALVEMEFDPEVLTCMLSPDLDITLANTGEVQEDVVLTVSNENLNYTETLSIGLNPLEVDTVVFNNINATMISGQETFDVVYTYYMGGVTVENQITIDYLGCLNLEEIVQAEDEAMNVTYDLNDYTNDETGAQYIFDIVEQIDETSCSINAGILSCGAPVTNYFGTSQLGITAVGSGRTEYVTHVVHDVPDAPVLFFIEDVADAEEGTAVEFVLNASDGDGGSLTFSVNESDATITQLTETSAQFSWTPGNDDNGLNELEFIVTDSTGLTDSQLVTITVQGMNFAPEITNPIPSYTDPMIGEDQTLSLSIEANDADGDEFTISWYIDTVLIPEANDQLSVLFDPAGATGTYTVEVVVQENETLEQLSSSFEWTITVSDVPVSEDFIGTMFDFTADELANATGVTIVDITGWGSIDFGTQFIDLRDVVDIDNNVVIDNGVMGINSVNLPTLDRPATLTFNNVDYDSNDYVMLYNEGFVQENGVECPTSRCSNFQYDSTNRRLTVEVSGFSLYWLFNASSVDNHDPVITSTPVDDTEVNTTYEYDVQATDSDGHNLTYTLTESPSGMTIDQATGLITWNPTVLDSYPVTVTVTDGFGGSDSQSFTLVVREPSKLAIIDLDVKVDGDTDKNLNDGDRISDEAAPESDVSFKFKIENQFTDDEDIEIRDVEVKVTIVDIDDEGTDDLEEESSQFDLDADKTKTVTLDFTIPRKVDEGDYDVIIEVTGEDEEDRTHEVEWNIILEVEKDKNDVRIVTARLGNPELECTRTTSLSVDVLNMGTEEQDEARLTIYSPALGLNVVKDFELSDNPYDDDAEYEFDTSISLSSQFEAGTYPITINAYYDTTKLSDTETIELRVRDCDRQEVSDVTEPSAPPYVGASQPSEPTTPVFTEPTEGSVSEISFRDSPEYILLLVVLTVIALGLVIFGVGAMIIKLR